MDKAEFENGEEVTWSGLSGYVVIGTDPRNSTRTVVITPAGCTRSYLTTNLSPIPSTVTVTVGSQSFEVEREDLEAFAGPASQWWRTSVPEGPFTRVCGALARAAAVELGVEG